MTGLSLLRTADIPFGAVTDFHLVATGTGLLLLATHKDGVCTWDPLRDRWAVHRLDSPRPLGKDGGPAAPTSLRALVVDGRVVVGGGAEGLPFTQWDLESGAVRAVTHHHPFDVESVGTLEGPGRSLFLFSPAAEAAAVWDVLGSGAGEHDREHPFVCDRAAAAGMLGHRPVLVVPDGDGYGIVVWDLDGRQLLVSFDEDLKDGEGLMAVGLAGDVAGRPRVVAAGDYDSVVLGDLDSGEWSEPFAIAQRGAGTGAPADGGTGRVMATGTATGRPVAVTCTDESDADPDFTSVLRAWDLEGRHALGEPVTAHEGGVLGVQLTELEGRTVATTVGRDDATVRVWALDR